MESKKGNELNDGWNLVELKELVDDPKKDIVDGPFGSNLKANEYIDAGVPVFKIQNIKANQFIDKNIVTIQPSLRPDDDSENPLICVYGDTFFSF